MPIFKVAFTVSKHYIDGSIRVEAHDSDEAERLVRGTDVARLMDLCSNIEWEVDPFWVEEEA